MTFIAWEHGEVLRVPTAWSAWRIGDVACERASDGSIVAFVGGKWRRVESWRSANEGVAASSGNRSVRAAGNLAPFITAAARRGTRARQPMTCWRRRRPEEMPS